MTVVFSRFFPLAIGAAGLAIVSLAGSSARAQTQNYELIPRENYDPPPPHPASVPKRAPETMEPQGGRLGSFWVFPSAEVTSAYDSNIQATNRNEKSDVFFRFAPKVRADSDLAGPVRLSFNAAGVVNRYVDHNEEDAEGYLLSHDGSWEVPALGERSFLKWGLANARDWLAHGLPDDQENGTEPTIVHTTMGYLGFQYKPGPLSISPRVSATYSDFDDVPAAGGGTINNDDRDRWVYRETLRVGYDFTPGYEGYVRGTLNQRRYDTTPDDTGFDRDSDGYEAVGGVKIGLSEITNLDVYAGYISQSYDDPRLRRVDGLGYGGQLNWSPRREWQIAGSVARSVDESILNEYASYLNTTYALSVYYQLVPALQFDARLAYSTFEFKAPSTTSADREDTMLMGQVGVRYYMTPNYYLRLAYMQTAYSSDAVNQDYDRSMVYLTFGAQY